MNLLLFVVVTLPLFLLWFAVMNPLPERVLLRGSRLGRSMQQLSRPTTASPRLACERSPGVRNVLAWSSTSGMEDSIMGMLYAPVLLVPAVAYVVLWFETVGAVLDEPVGFVVGYFYRIQEEDHSNNDYSKKKKKSGASSMSLPAVS